MTNSFRTGPSPVSRRTLLRRAVGTAGAAVLFSLGIAADGALADSKVSQKAVAYQDTPNGSKSCANCALFQAPNACKSVDGTISPHGWCRIWRAKS
jgi:hypothetical protein